MLITYQAKLLEKRLLAGDVYFIRFSYPENPDFSYIAGQYMILHIPQPDGTIARRLYSIASPPSQKESLDMIIQFVPNGVAGAFLSKMNIGENLTVQGPAGLFTLKQSVNHPIFLATGTGIAPMYSMISSQVRNSKFEIRNLLFWGLKNYTDLYIFSELKKLAETYPNFSFKICLSREANLDMIPDEDKKYFTLGRVTNQIDEMISEGTIPSLRLEPVLNSIQEEGQGEVHDFYLCGGKEIVEGLKAHLQNHNIPKERVHFEKFT